jgi:nitroreductase
MNDMLGKIRHTIGKRWNTFRTVYHEYFILIKHLGSNERINNKDKERAFLLMELHTIEKGLSLKDIKIGFGQPKVKHILKLAAEFISKYQDYSILNYVLPPISEYINFHKEHNFLLGADIESEYNSLISKKDINHKEYGGGTIEVTKKDILNAGNIDFEKFSKFRFSIRNFTGKEIPREKIYKALQMAQKTPSPCNRQPWRNYVVFNRELIDKVISVQQGGRQFKNDLDCIIVVTSGYHNFFGTEYHQAHVSGGMYAMSLIYALHSQGLGTVPLNLGISRQKLIEIHRLLGISYGNAPIMIVGVGDIADNLKVAYAERFDYKDYTIVFEK